MTEHLDTYNNLSVQILEGVEEKTYIVVYTSKIAKTILCYCKTSQDANNIAQAMDLLENTNVQFDAGATRVIIEARDWNDALYSS